MLTTYFYPVEKQVEIHRQHYSFLRLALTHKIHFTKTGLEILP